MRHALDSLHDLPFPAIAVIDGPCMGAGVALALACDVRIAGEHACFAIPPARLGISYPQEDVDRLVRVVGRGQAARLLFGGERIGVAEAARIGLVEQSAKSAEHEAERFAATIAANAPGSLIALKAILNAGGRQSQEFDVSFDLCFSNPAFVEGLAAFRDGREPEFD